MATVEVILEAAARILEREGYGPRFGTNRIAQAAGVSIGSLYEYFEGRDAIVQALCERHMSRVRALVDRVFDELKEAKAPVAVDLFMDALFTLHEHRPDLQRALHHQFPMRLGLQAYIDSDRYLEERLVEWLVPRVPGVDSATLATRAFIAVRAGRAVTIQVFAEALSEERKVAVREGLKQMLLHTLGLG